MECVKFMPDHVHLVVEGCRPDSDLCRMVKVLKQRVAYNFRTILGIRPVWQDAYYDRILRDEQAVMTVVRYVLENPVRAGLVQRAEDDPFSGRVASN